MVGFHFPHIPSRILYIDLMSVGNAAPGTRAVKDRPIIWAKAMGLSKSQALVRHYNHYGNWQKQ